MAAKDDGKWEDCGCNKSMAFKDAFKLDMTWCPHICSLVSRDEWLKHYILDRPAYIRACRAAEDSFLGVWIRQRLQEQRLFVAKPPDRPPLPPEPWRFDEPPLLSGPLEPGWRYWEPADDALRFDGYTTPQMYDETLDEFFDMLGIEHHLKKLMMESGEAWILACGTPPVSVKVFHRTPFKNDRVFVTADNDFFAVIHNATRNKTLITMFAKWLEELGLRNRMKHLLRLLDIRIDSKIRMGGCGHVFNFL